MIHPKRLDRRVGEHVTSREHAGLVPKAGKRQIAEKVWIGVRIAQTQAVKGGKAGDGKNRRDAPAPRGHERLSHEAWSSPLRNDTPEARVDG